jgi:hypothetical protein
MEENKENNVVLRKLHLSSLIKVLVDLYESGVDYVDLCGKNDVEQDVVDIRFTREYTVFKDKSEDEAMESIKENFEKIIEDDEEDEEEEDVIPPPPTTKYKLSDDDLNQLL